VCCPGSSAGCLGVPAKVAEKIIPEDRREDIVAKRQADVAENNQERMPQMVVRSGPHDFSFREGIQVRHVIVVLANGGAALRAEPCSRGLRRETPMAERRQIGILQELLDLRSPGILRDLLPASEPADDSIYDNSHGSKDANGLNCHGQAGQLSGL